MPEEALVEDMAVERSRRLPRESADALDNILRLGSGSKEAAPATAAYRPLRARRDSAAALDAVHQAAEAIRATEGQAREAEARGLALAERALKELKIAEGRVQAAEAAARAAEARAREAEAQAREAEDWLMRLQDAIKEHIVVRVPGSGSGSTAAA